MAAPSTIASSTQPLRPLPNDESFYTVEAEAADAGWTGGEHAFLERGLAKPDLVGGNGDVSTNSAATVDAAASEAIFSATGLVGGVANAE